jgi:hypothetical protein
MTNRGSNIVTSQLTAPTRLSPDDDDDDDERKKKEKREKRTHTLECEYVSLF